MAVEKVKYYTMEEVLTNNGKDGNQCWVIMKDVVYNVTEYLDEHPGDRDLILEHAGKDATKDFEDVGHSGDAKKLLKTYKIGELVEDERKKKIKKTSANGPTIKESQVEEVRRSCLAVITCGVCA